MKQRDIPRELWIKDELWNVKFVRKLFLGKVPIDGLCDPSTRTISIIQGLSYIDRAETFYHEILHAFCFEYNFEIPHKHIYTLGEAFSDLLVNNF